MAGVSTEGVGDSHVDHDVLVEKSAFTQACPVNELAGNDKVEWREFLLQAANGADRNDPFDAE
jgi:hypothetical protein